MGGNIVLRPDVLDFRPAILVQYIPAEAPIEVDINASIVVKDAAWFGVTYRSNELLKQNLLISNLHIKWIMV